MTRATFSLTSSSRHCSFFFESPRIYHHTEFSIVRDKNRVGDGSRSKYESTIASDPDRKSPSTRRASSGRVRAGLKPAAHSSRPADGPLIERDPFYLGRNLERASSIVRRSPLDVRQILRCLASAFKLSSAIFEHLSHNKITMCARCLYPLRNLL